MGVIAEVKFPCRKYGLVFSAFSLFFLIAYVFKPLAYFISDTDLQLWIFDTENYISNLPFMFLSAFLFFFLFTLSYRYSDIFITKVTIKTERLDHSGRGTVILMLIIGAIFLSYMNVGYTNAYLVLLDIIGLYALSFLILSNKKVISIVALAIVIWYAFNHVYLKSSVLTAIICMLVYAQYLRPLFFYFLNFGKPLAFNAAILITLLLVGILQNYRWFHGEFALMNFATVVAGFSTTFDSSDSFLKYIDQYDIFSDFGYWVYDFLILVPRDLYESKPLVYGTTEISNILYPGIFQIDKNTGVGSGQFSVGVLVLAFDYLPIVGILIYPVVIGLLIKLADSFLTSSSLLLATLGFTFLIKANALIRIGLTGVIYMIPIFFFIGLLFVFTRLRIIAKRGCYNANSVHMGVE